MIKGYLEYISKEIDNNPHKNAILAFLSKQ